MRAQLFIDDCASSPCQNVGACVAGFEGETCDARATDIDDGAYSPCQNGETYSDEGVNRYLTSACAAGFEVKIVLVMLSGSLVYDECYICGGDNETCKDCAGDVKGSLLYVQVES